MRHDDDLDDFSHLPSVDDIASAAEKKALWEQQHRKAPEPQHIPEPEPEHSPEEVIMEEQLLAHELPVDQDFSAAEHTSHAPEWAEEAYVTEEVVEAAPAIEPEPPDWVRETYEQAAEEPAKKKRKDPELHPQTDRVSDAATAKKITAPVPIKVDLTKLQAAKPPEKASLAKEKDIIPDEVAPVVPKPEKLPSFDDKHEGAAKTEDSSKTDDAPPPLPPHVGPPADVPEPDAKERFRQVWEKIGGRALAASIGVHVLLLVIAAFVIIQTVGEKQIDFLPGGGSKGASEAAQSLQHKVQSKRNTWLKNKAPLKRVVSTSASQNITLPDAPPDLDFPDASKLLGGKGMSGGGGFGTAGIGKGFGAGLGFGGKINFMGHTGVGKNIVFVMDVSASMSAMGDSGTGRRISRFDLLKNELTKTLGRLPPNTQYQVIFFSDFAWPHNEVDSRNLQAFDKYKWFISPEKVNVRVPQFRYVTANTQTVARSIDIIKDSDNPGGTNWGSGLFMALKAFPKPDVVFFMTDGNKLDADGWVEAVTKLNLSGGKRTIIHTTAMMEPDAALELDQLAKLNGGNFTIITAKGFTLTGEEFFKGRN